MKTYEVAQMKDLQEWQHFCDVHRDASRQSEYKDF